jgi:hypothetical protein
VKEKKARKAGTLSKRTGSVYAARGGAESSADIPAVAAPAAPPAAFTRSGENSVRSTWGPQSAARLEEALYAMARSGTTPTAGAPDSARGPPSGAGSVNPPNSGPNAGASPRGGKKVRAKWSFAAEREGELSMGVGDTLSIIDQTNQNWWMAELNGKRGVIPANYVELLPEEPALPGTPPLISNHYFKSILILFGK